jgi:hypothetical protein
MKTWYYIYESCEGPALLAVEAASEPDAQDVIDAHPEIPFQLSRDDEWLTGPIALPLPRCIKQPTAANVAIQEENDGSETRAEMEVRKIPSRP